MQTKLFNVVSLFTAVIVFCLPIVAFCVENSEPENEITKVENEIIATVNGEKIMASEIKHITEATHGQIPVDEILKQRIGRRAVRQFLDKENFTIEDKKVDEEIAKIEKIYKDQGQDIDEMLKSSMMTREQFHEEVKFQVRLQKYLEGKITDDEIISGMTQVRASHILVKTDDDTTSEQAKKKIEEIQSELRKSDKLRETFAEFARKNSDCPSGSGGGDLGFFYRHMMVKPFADTAFSLEIGQMSQPVETQFGWHLILVTDRKSMTKEQYESRKEPSRHFYLQMKTISFVNEVTEKADVVLYEDGKPVKNDDSLKETGDSLEPVEKKD